MPSADVERRIRMDFWHRAMERAEHLDHVVPGSADWDHAVVRQLKVLLDRDEDARLAEEADDAR